MRPYSLIVLGFLVAAVLLVSRSWAQVPTQIPPHGGASLDLSAFDEFSPEDRALIEAEIEKNVERLIATGKLSTALSEQRVSFAWPLRPAAGLSDPGYHITGGFVDLDPSGGKLDYNCGTRTYNGHRGVDTGLWPFGWYKMDHEEVAIVAAAPGTVVLTRDGDPDRSCDVVSQPGNGVVVRHADGSETEYWHMKNGSVAPKAVGDAVEAGEYLGIVGSSGNSSGPHLHLATRDADGKVVEPHAGECNNTIDSSWWESQKPYRDSAVNALLTHSDAPVFPDCPQQEILHLKDAFEPGAQAWFAGYTRNQIAGDTTVYSILTPDGFVWRTWSHIQPATQDVSWWIWYWHLPQDAPEGQWSWEADYKGVHYTHSFTVGQTPPTPALSTPESGASPVSTTLILRWAVSNHANSYQVEVADQPDFGEALLHDTTSSNEIEFVAGHVLTDYHWRVRALGLGGTSEWSESRQFTTGLEGPLVAPLLAPDDGASRIAIDAPLTWGSAKGAATYRLQVADEGGFETIAAHMLESILVDREGLTDTSDTVTGLQPGHTYHWRVAGVDDQDRQTFGVVRRFTTGTAPASTPTLIAPVEGSTGESGLPEFVWSDVEGAELYHLQVDVDEGFPMPLIDDSTIVDTTYSVIGPLAYSTQFYWRVRGENEFGSGPWSPAPAFTTSVGTAVEEAGAIPDRYALRANYPNPFHSRAVIQIDLPEATHVTLAVYDVLGKVVLRLESGTVTTGRHTYAVDASDLSSGVYLYRLETPAFSQSRRMMLLK